MLPGGRVDRRDGAAETGQRLRDEPTAAADVETGEAP